MVQELCMAHRMICRRNIRLTIDVLWVFPDSQRVFPPLDHAQQAAEDQAMKDKKKRGQT
jgi:hypothetical protein